MGVVGWRVGLVAGLRVGVVVCSDWPQERMHKRRIDRADGRRIWRERRVVVARCDVELILYIFEDFAIVITGGDDSWGSTDGGRSWVERTPESAVAWAVGFLHAAAHEGRVEKVMALLEETPAAVGTTDSSGKTAELLISRAASMTARDGDDKTPLGLCEGNADMVSALLPRVSLSDVNKALLSNSHTLLHWAGACGNVEVIECLVSGLRSSRHHALACTAGLRSSLHHGLACTVVL